MNTNEENIDINIEGIQKTNAVLNDLQARLNKYMSNSRIITQRAPAPLSFVMPNIQIPNYNRFMESPDRKSKQNINKSNGGLYESQKKNPSLQSNQISQSKQLNRLEEQIREYKNKIKVQRQTNDDKFQELYDNKSRRLQDDIQQLSKRKSKIQNDREILNKENRRLVQLLREKQRQYNQFLQKQANEKQRIREQKQRVVQIKRKKILVDIQKERLLSERHEKQIKDLQSQIRIMKQSLIVPVNFQFKHSSLSRSKTKLLPRKSKSSNQKSYPSSQNKSNNRTIETLKTIKPRYSAKKYY